MNFSQSQAQSSLDTQRTIVKNQRKSEAAQYLSELRGNFEAKIGQIRKKASANVELKPLPRNQDIVQEISASADLFAPPLQTVTPQLAEINKTLKKVDRALGGLEEALQATEKRIDLDVLEVLKGVDSLKARLSAAKSEVSDLSTWLTIFEKVNKGDTYFF